MPIIYSGRLSVPNHAQRETWLRFTEQLSVFLFSFISVCLRIFEYIVQQFNIHSVTVQTQILQHQKYILCAHLLVMLQILINLCLRQ